MRKSTWLAVTMAILASNGLVGCGPTPSQLPPETAAPKAQTPSMPTNVKPNAPQTLTAPAAPQPQAPSVTMNPTPAAAPAAPVTPAQLAEYALPKEGPIYQVQGGVTPVPVAPPAGHTRVAFQSCRYGGGGESDIFVYDFDLDTVLALPAVNTPAAEVNAEISANGRHLVYQTDINGTWDIRMFDLQTLLINTLPGLNTEAFDETQPDISDNGQIVFVQHDCVSHGFETLRIYDGVTGDTYIVPVRQVVDVTWPTISADGSTIAFGAFPIGFGSQDIYFYRLGTGVVTPPFVNSAANDYNPELSADGSAMLFVSDRNGSEDIYMLQADGWINNFTFANTAGDEQEPRFLDPGTIIFQSTGGGPITLRLTGIDSGLIDTLPIASAGGLVNAQLRSYLPNTFDPFPGSPFIGGGGPDDCLDCGSGPIVPGPIGFPGDPIGYPGPIGIPGGYPLPDKFEPKPYPGPGHDKDRDRDKDRDKVKDRDKDKDKDKVKDRDKDRDKVKDRDKDRDRDKVKDRDKDKDKDRGKKKDKEKDKDKDKGRD